MGDNDAPTPPPNPPTTPPPGDPPAGSGDAGPDRGDLKAAIREVLSEMGVGSAPNGSGDPSGTGDGGSGDPSGDAGSGRLHDEELRLENLVRRELERVKVGEEVGSLKEQIKKIVERPPRQFRRIEKLMGWATEDD